MKKIYLSLLLFFLSFLTGYSAAKFELTRVDPPNWWVGMHDTTLQLCVYGRNISKAYVSLIYQGVTVARVNKVDNPDYLFIDLTIASDAKPGTIALRFAFGEEQETYDYRLLKPPPAKYTHCCR